MGILRRMFGYATIGAAKVAGKRAWESEEYIESAMHAAEAGLWVEAARILLEREAEDDEDDL